jgi:predicted PurR-regulated permease PerM
MNETEKKPLFETVIQLMVLFLLIAWCFAIVLPFIGPVVSAAIIATVVYPLFAIFKRWFGNRGVPAVLVVTLIMLLVILAPTAWIVGSLIDGIKNFAVQFRDQAFTIPPPDPKVAEWPVIGKPITDIWLLASQNLVAVITTYKDPLSKVGLALLGSVAGLGSSMAVLFLSVIIAGFMMLKAEAAIDFLKKLFSRLAGERGEEILQTAGVTVKNVAKGILGVAFIQFILAGAIFLIAGIPFAGLWALCVLVLAILQLPSALVIIPVIIYLFASVDLVPAILYAVGLLIVSLLDNILKPILMGKGASVPMLVIFIGAIGGFIFSGFIGLFTGAIILSVGYNLMINWVAGEQDK